MSGALDAILKPRSVAVIGASRSPNTIGHQVLANIVRYGFTGTVRRRETGRRFIGAARTGSRTAIQAEPEAGRAASSFAPPFPVAS